MAQELGDAALALSASRTSAWRKPPGVATGSSNATRAVRSPQTRSSPSGSSPLARHSPEPARARTVA